MRNSVALAALAALLGLAVVALATQTARWEIDTYDKWSEGETKDLELDSTGALQPVWTAEGRTVNAEGVWTMAEGPAGELYLGTGNRGKLFQVRGRQIKEIFTADHVAVTRVRVDRGGRVFFSAAPGGVIYLRESSGEVRKFADLDETYIWDFIFDRGGLLVATGPNGRIFRLSAAGKIESVIETKEDHVMCLLSDRGRTFAGTSGGGLVLELVGKNDFRVLHEFDEKEVRRLLAVESEGGLALIAAVNQEAGTRPPEGPARPFTRTRGEAAGDGGDDEEDGQRTAPAVAISTPPVARGDGKVDGAVYAIFEGRGVRKLMDLPKRAAIDLARAGQDIYVATDQEGKVYRCRPDDSNYAISFDLEPAQALSLIADEKGLAWIGTGAPATLVQVKKGIGQKPTYTSKALDAGFPARWGVIDWQADGPVLVKTRSGNLKDPERGWSNWEPLGLGQPGRIKSPPARYLQVRVEWPLGSRARLSRLSISYRVHNQAHYVERVIVEPSDRDGAGERRPARQTQAKSGPGARNPSRQIAWKVDNPDQDPLEFTLHFQPEGKDHWIPIKTPEPITDTKFKWETEAIPDGWYRIKVTASDAPANPPGEEFTASSVSERFLIDNQPPEIKGLVVIGNKVMGRAVDKTSAISGLEYSIDGGEWVTITSEDGVLDQTAESFKFDLPEDLEPGLHIITVRAWDRAMNIGSAQRQFVK